MSPDRVIAWHADWTAQAEAWRAVQVAGLNETLASLGLEPVRVA